MPRHPDRPAFFSGGPSLRQAEPYAAARSSFSAPRITILSASSAKGRCSAFASSHDARIQMSARFSRMMTVVASCSAGMQHILRGRG